MSDIIAINDTTYGLITKNDPKDRIEVEIGDSKQIDFYPQVKIKRWDNEVNFSIRLVYNELTPIVSLDQNIIKWDGKKLCSHFYEIPISTELPDGGYEFEIILKEKPITNRIEFTIDVKGLDFFYQPPLTEEIKIGDERGLIVSVTETDAFDKKGNVIIHRPENVVSSYAAYASENKTNRIGGKIYKAGKVVHIFRPKIIDNTGRNWVWGTLNINKDKGILSVEIPQDFVDTAIYPIRHAAGLTLGLTTVGASSGTGTNGYGSAYTMIEDGLVASVSQYVNQDNTHVVGAAIYNDNGSNYPSTKLAEDSGNATGTGAAAWLTVNLTAKLNPNTKYWLAGWANDSRTIYWDVGTTNQWTTFGSMTWETWETPLAGGNDQYDRKLSIYATYTPGANNLYFCHG